jgi:cell division septation protein DedD
MRQPKQIALLVAIGTCLAAAGCGSDDEGASIPAAQAAELELRLDEVQRRFEFGDGACDDIQNDSRPGIEEVLGTLPEDVDEDVRQALEDGFDRLFDLSSEQCDEDKGQETESEPVPVVPEPEPTPTETETVPTETETTPTETETETEPEPEPEEEEGAEGGSLPPLDGQSLDGGAVAPEGNG